jgi:hypothetical protein
MTKNSERQDRIEQLLAQGYTRNQAVGIVYASEAGEKPLPAHGVDEGSTRLSRRRKR